MAPNERGQRLAVGRDREIQLVAQKLHKQGKVTCVDGHIGVGKTSLTNVAAYRCLEAFKARQSTQLLLPVAEAFQLTPNGDADAFCSNVFRRVAQTLIRYREELSGIADEQPGLAGLHAWLNSPVVEHINGALGVAASVGAPGVASVSGSAGASGAKQLNTSAAFADQGFEQWVRQWLEELFSVQGNGAVVCVIDNLELLETAANARRTLEALRDRLFNINGLRWVFCGANGVIHALAASTRLEAFLNSPILNVGHVSPSSIAPLMRARYREFAMKDSEEVERLLPLRMKDIEWLYQIVNFNLRDLLALADEYCEFMHSTGTRLMSEDHKGTRFAKWLEKRTTEAYANLSSRLPNDAWVILDLVMSDEFKGSFGVGDYEALNRNSRKAVAQSTFEKRLKDLIKHSLISKNIDDEAGTGEDEFKREIFTVTPKGAMVHYARLVKNENQGLKPLTWLRRVNG
ncbi:hypothetical protein [Roseateles sp. P5_D6]